MKWLSKFFKKLWNAIRKVLAIILIIIAVILLVWATLATGGATLALFGFVLSTTQALIIGGLALAGAFLVDRETASKTVGKIADAAGDAAESVGGAIGKVTGGAATGVVGAILDNPVLLWGGIAVAAYFLLRSDSDDSKVARVSVSSAPPQTRNSPTSVKNDGKKQAQPKPKPKGKGGTRDMEALLG